MENMHGNFGIFISVKFLSPNFCLICFSYSKDYPMTTFPTLASFLNRIQL